MSDDFGDLPPWVELDLCRELPVLRSSGENQELEYKEAFPDQARDLGKEIAAFASTNPGMILLGVGDDGTLIGLDGMESAESRDILVRRIGGICTSQIKPSITPSLSFGIENGNVVLAISVPKGSQPIYYCGNIPYVRHIADSRPAEPHEVIDLISAWIAARGVSIDEQSYEIRFLVEMGNLLAPLLIFGEEVEERNVNPWISLLKAEYGVIAEELRYQATTEISNELNLVSDLNAIADVADEVANYRHTMGQESWQGYLNLVRTAQELARDLKASRIDSVPLPEDRATEALEEVRQSARYLQGLSGRAKEIAFQGRVEELKSEASSVGRTLLHLSYTALDRLEEEFVLQLRGAAKQLHLIETRQIFLDGGKSLSEVVDAIAIATEDIGGLAQQLDP